MSQWGEDQNYAAGMERDARVADYIERGEWRK